MCCDVCHGVVKGEIKEWKFCSCGEIGGHYEEDGSHFTYTRLTGRSRVIGVDNNVRYGFERRGNCWVQEANTRTGKNLTEVKYTSKMATEQIAKKLQERKKKKLVEKKSEEQDCRAVCPGPCDSCEKLK